MAIKKTTQVGEPVIRAKAKKVSDISSTKTKRVIQNLIDSMRKDDLVGMAAPQIGEGLQIFVTEVRNTKFRDPKDLDPVRVFINPRILSSSKKQVKDWEGCGSVAHAGLFAKVPRSHSVEVEAYNEKGEKFKLKASGLLARIIQHEYDHLQGVLCIDKADLKTLMGREEYLAQKKKARKHLTAGKK